MRYWYARERDHLPEEVEALHAAGFSYACSYRVTDELPRIDLLRELWSAEDGTAAMIGHSGQRGRELNVVTVLQDGDILRTIGLCAEDAQMLPRVLGQPDAGLYDELHVGLSPDAVLELHRGRVRRVAAGRATWPVRTFRDVRRLGARTGAILEQVADGVVRNLLRVLLGVAGGSVLTCCGGLALVSWQVALPGTLALFAGGVGAGWAVLVRWIPVRTAGRVAPTDWPRLSSRWTTTGATGRPRRPRPAPGR